MKPLLALAAAVLATVPPSERAAELSLLYAADTATTVELERTSVLELAGVRVRFEGRDVPQGEDGDLERQELSRTELVVRHTDRVEAVRDGRPARVVREFDELTDELTDAEDGTTTESGVLEGRSLVLAVDEDGELDVRLRGEQDVADEYLEGHLAGHVVDLLVPDGELEPGDSWEAPDAALDVLLGVGEPEYFELDDEDADDRLLEQDLWAAADVESELTFDDVEERDGVECAVIDVELGYASRLDDVELADYGLDFDLDVGSGEPDSEAVEISLEVEGRLWIELATRRPVAFELAGTADLDVVSSFDTPDGRVEIVFDFEIRREEETRWTHDG